MRYKSFIIEADAIEYDVYGNLPALAYVEVHDVEISSACPKWTTDKRVCMSEDHPAFNFDLWADVIDFIDEDKHIFTGTEELDMFIIKHFPHVMEYYRDNELI